MRWCQVRFLHSVDVSCRVLVFVIGHEDNFELIRDSNCGRLEGQTPRVVDKLRADLAKLSFGGITLYMPDRMM